MIALILKSILSFQLIDVKTKGETKIFDVNVFSKLTE